MGSSDALPALYLPFTSPTLRTLPVTHTSQLPHAITAWRARGSRQAATGQPDAAAAGPRFGWGDGAGLLGGIGGFGGVLGRVDDDAAFGEVLFGGGSVGESG